MKVDREVPMGMMGCLQILLGGGGQWNHSSDSGR